MFGIEEFVYFAFLMGIVSAASLPLGTLTTLVWQPSDKALAWLMAFGAGALLSAVTVDLFGPAVETGFFAEVSIGAIIGSLVYLFLNKLVNEKGGFLRKTATAIQFLRKKQKKEEITFLETLNRIPLFENLPESDELTLLNLVEIVSHPAGTTIYHPGDAHNAFYFIQTGEIKIQDPQMGLKTFIHLEAKDAFGRMAFFTSQTNGTMAVAKTDVTLWKLSRDSFNELLSTSDQLWQNLVSFYEQDNGFNVEMIHYLQNRHQFSEKAAKDELQQIISLLRLNRSLADVTQPEKDFSLAQKRLQSVKRFPLIESANELFMTDVAHALELRNLKTGETLYKSGSDADRIYLLEEGIVDLVDPIDKRGELNHMVPGDFFGVRAFVVGGKKATTAIARTDIRFWVIDKQDFEALLFQHDQVRGQFLEFLKSENIENYLIQEHKLAANKAHKWIKKSVKHLVPGRMPSLNEFTVTTQQHKMAYIAIWLGIFLDGIPESLVIGAQTTGVGLLSMSLIAGLFLSNYPEALSSSASMREQGIRFPVILWAWTSLMLLTGIGAAIGSVVFQDASPSTFALISGIAAGAMLTVIAETMLPEAYYKGGSIIGFVTLLGFIAALFFKILDPSSGHH